MKRTSKTIFSLIILTLISAGQIQAKLKAPEVLNSAIAKGTSKKPVLIYYTNETRETEEAKKNTNSILMYMKSSMVSYSKNMVKRIESDRVKFANVVDEEVAEIKKAVAQGSLSRVLIFTNLSVSKGEFLYNREGSKEFTKEKFNVPAFNNIVYKSQPLAHVDCFKEALRTAADMFSTDEHEFVLITKSHGAITHAMVPMVGMQFDEFRRSRLFKHLFPTVKTAPPARRVTIPSSAPTASTPPKNISNSASFIGGKVNGNLNNSLAEESDVLDGNKGISKQDYSSTISTLGKEKGMTFRLVFIESCFSELAPAHVENMNQNVGLLYTSDSTGLKYQTIFYGEVFAKESGDSADRIDEALREASVK